MVKRISDIYDKSIRNRFMLNNEDYDIILEEYKKENIADYVEVIIYKKKAEIANVKILFFNFFILSKFYCIYIKN